MNNSRTFTVRATLAYGKPGIECSIMAETPREAATLYCDQYLLGSDTFPGVEQRPRNVGDEVERSWRFESMAGPIVWVFEVS